MGFIIPINPDERLVIKHEAMSSLGAVTRNHPFNSNILYKIKHFLIYIERGFTIMSKIYTSADQLIGHTPLLELTHIEAAEGLEAKLLAKL